LIVGAFAIFHGYAHGAELPGNANALGYSAGFVVATGLLHLAGIALSMLDRLPKGEWAVRAGGAAITAAGFVFLLR
jgi:urease accessory protein